MAGTILHYCIDGDLEKIKELHQSGQDIHFENEYPLQIACQYGHIDIVKYLVENNAKITADNNLAFRWSCIFGYPEIARYLFENSTMDISSENNNALVWSFHSCKFDSVRFLVEKGVNIATQNYQLMMYNLSYDNFPIMKYMCQFNPDLSDILIGYNMDLGQVTICIYLSMFGVKVNYKYYHYDFINFYSLLSSFYFSDSLQLENSEYDPKSDYLWDANIGLIVALYSW
jgi:hypothetical protein